MDYTPVEIPVGGMDDDESGELANKLLVDAYRVSLNSFLPDQRDHVEEVVNDIATGLLEQIGVTEDTPDDFGQPMFDAVKTALCVAFLRSSQLRSTMSLSVQVRKTMADTLKKYKTTDLS